MLAGNNHEGDDLSSIEELKAQRDALQKKISELEVATRQASNADFLGRCFTFRNRFSCAPHGQCDTWTVYFKVLALNGTGFTTFQFQRDPTGVVTIEPSRYCPNIGGNVTEITPEEFQSQYDCLVGLLGSLVL